MTKKKLKLTTIKKAFISFMDKLLYIEGENDDDDIVVITRKKKQTKKISSD